ncbi:MAG: hypothetical protein ACRC1W_10765, partial [Shewanella sp.]
DASAGMQFSATQKTFVGTQFTGVIAANVVAGVQFQAVIANSATTGAQFEGVIAADAPAGVQFQSVIADTQPAGVQFNPVIGGGNNAGIQFQGVIAADSPQGVQFDAQIGEQVPAGVQFNSVISTAAPTATQFEGVIAASSAAGFQFAPLITQQSAYGVQFNGVIAAGPVSSGLQFTPTTHPHHRCGGYLTEAEYLSGYPYLAEVMCFLAPVQFNVVNTQQEPLGLQFQGVITAARPLGTQFRGVIDTDYAAGTQFTVVSAARLGAQFRVVLYNTTNQRILCEFASRGAATTGGGNNAWGNPKGEGESWLSTSTQSGDFSVQNLNTDIIEQFWRSATGTKVVNLSCDTEVTQGVFMDTLAILNHNLTSSASIVLQGSNDSGFASVPFSAVLTYTRENIYYIAPSLPQSSYRYWRLQLDDTSNPDNFLRIGAVLFGASALLQGECFVDQITYGRRHFKDVVNTEGFTNVSNDRGLKRFLRMDFKSLNFSGRNYDLLQEVFETARTSLKCLWIPTPEYASRYAVFAKLADLPEEKHNDRGPEADYVSFDLSLDESL